MIGELFNQLSPVNQNDIDEWEEIKSDVRVSQYQIIWYASSGLDLYPVIAGVNGKLPTILSEYLHNPVLIMSDYSPECLSSLKEVYAKLDYGSVRVLWNEQNWFRSLGNFSCNIDVSETSSIEGEAFIEQMIPLKLWESRERDIFKQEYEYHYSMLTHPVPDDSWHLVYFLLRLSSGSSEAFLPIIFVAAENLLIFEKIFEAYQIPIDIFFAVRVAGKSGSWDYTHDFKRGKLPHELETAALSLRPKFWGLEEAKWGDALPTSFSKIGKISGLGYGGCTVFQTNWER